MQIDSLFDAMIVETAPFSLCELAPRGWLDMPRTDMATLHYVLSGTGQLHVRGQKARMVTKGDLILVPAGQSHSLGAADGKFVTFAACRPASLGLTHHRTGESGEGRSGTGLAVLCAHVTLGLSGAGPVIDLLRDLIIEPITADNGGPSAIDLIVAELTDPGPGSRPMVRALLLYCLIGTLRRRVERGDSSVSWLIALADTKLWPALATVLNAPGADHSVESMANEVGMSRSRFAAQFSASFGVGPMQIVKELRLQYAARLLLEKRAGVARVAELAGYASRSHFTDQFAAYFGMPPGQYAKGATSVEPAAAE